MHPMKTNHKNINLRSYKLKLSGSVDDDFVISFCPTGLSITREGDLTILDNILTDQSGILGLFRHLHNMGCTILLMSCCPEK